MRNWDAAVKAVQKETGLNVGRLGGGHGLPVVIAAGDARPHAVMALGGVDPDEPSETLAQLAMLAIALKPTRVLVAVSSATSHSGRSGLLVGWDVTAVADGRVEFARAWRWYRLGRFVFWPPVEVRMTACVVGLLDRVATYILSNSEKRWPSELIDALVERTVASGHRVRFARRLPRVDTG